MGESVKGGACVRLPRYFVMKTHVPCVRSWLVVCLQRVIFKPIISGRAQYLQRKHNLLKL